MVDEARTVTLQEIEKTWAELRTAAAAARSRPYEQVLDAVDAWSRQWDDAGSVCWRQVEGAARVEPFVEEAIRTLARSARRDLVEKLIEEQLGHPEVLAKFVPRPAGGFRRAHGCGGIAIFLGGGAALASWPLFLLGIISRCAVFARMTEADQQWPLLFKRTLAEIDQGLAACIQADHWASIDDRSHRGLAAGADLVMAFGSDTTMEQVRKSVPPTTSFIPFGSRMSLGVVGSGLSIGAAASLAAVDITIYDQGGCLSPQSFLVEGSIERARRFSNALGAEMARQPAPAVPLRDAARLTAIRQARDLAAFEEGSMVIGPEDLGWTVLFSARAALEPSPLGRTVHVRSYRSVEEAQRLLRPFEGKLDAAGVGAGSDRERIEIAGWLAPMGVTRVCPLGSMQFPPLSWSHDGRSILASMVRFTDVE